MNNKITSFLYQHRKLIAIKSLIKNGMSLAAITLFVCIFITTLEVFSYFDSYTRIRLLIFFSLALLSISVYMLIVFLYQKQGRISSFSNESLSRDIGKNNKEISDNLTNAYQLMKIKTDNEISNDLRNYAVKKMSGKLDDIQSPKIRNVFYRRISIIAILFSFLFMGFLLDNEFSSAANRLINPAVEYEIPVPFSIINHTENQILLEGDSLVVKFGIIDGIAPDSINIVISKIDQLMSAKVPYSNGSFEYNIKNIQSDFTYRAEYESNSFLEPWDLITSSDIDVEVIRRPRIISINFLVIPPNYSKLPEESYSANNTDISMLVGSKLLIEASANKRIQNSWALVGEDNITLFSRDSLITGSIEGKESLEVTLMCQDYNGIENINPPLNKIKVIPDYKPQIFVSTPENEFDIKEDRLINIDMQIIDDFGFSGGWLEYKIIRPEYLYQDSSIYRDEIPEIDFDGKAQKITYNWNVSNLGLAPDDKIEFYISIADNNNITGPSIAMSGPFIGKVPSLEDLFESINDVESDVMESTEQIALTIDEVKELVDNLEKEMLKSDEISWENTQKINESSEKIDDIINEIESIKEMLQNVQEQAEENELFNNDLVQKFDEFQKLLDKIMTPEMLETLNKIKEMMSEMNTDQMLDAVQNLKNDMSMLDEQLDRFIELFEMVMSEQALEEIIKILEELRDQQMDISNELVNRNDELEDLYTLGENQINGFNTLKRLISDNIAIISKFSSLAGEKLNNLLSSELIKKTEKDLLDTSSSLENNNTKNALNGSELVITDFNELLDIIKKIQEQFNNESVNKMTAEFITLLKNIESISYNQEILINTTKDMRSNNPRLREIAFNENLIQNQIIKFLEQLIILSNKTFHIPPSINRSIGAAQLAVQKSIGAVEQKNMRKARTEQKKALNSVNETAYLLITSLENMQSSMSASGMESYLEQLEKMAGEQQKINQGTGQCMMPGSGMPGQLNLQEALMKRLQAQQEALQEQLGDMMSDMPGGGDTGGLSKSLEDMDDVIEDFKRRQIDKKTIERQEKILSRMLDSQKSLKQKDYNEKRKSKTADIFEFDGPSSLPDDYGERQSILTDALEDALNHGYSTEYQIVLKKYFKYLEEIDNE